MYERHWQLSRSPFRPHDSQEFYCPLAAHQAALRKLQFVLEQRQSAAALIGPTGIGKSYLVRRLTANLPEDFGPVITVNFPCLSALELVRYLTVELADRLGETLQRPSGLDEWLVAWEKLLRRIRAPRRVPVIVVDDAHIMEDRALWQTWQLLLASREQAGFDFSVLFIGQPELVGRFQRCVPLEERLALTATLVPLTQEQTADYISHRLHAAGSQTEIFAASAVAEIWNLSSGLPRRIDRLCDFSLLVGCADGLTQITSSQITAVAQELRGRVAA